jgi:hypothetical protein
MSPLGGALVWGTIGVEGAISPSLKKTAEGRDGSHFPQQLRTPHWV